VTVSDVIGCDEQVGLVKRFGVGQANLDQKLSIRVNIPCDLVLRFFYFIISIYIKHFIFGIQWLLAQYLPNLLEYLKKFGKASIVF
jgi:hypothetical protein